MRHTSVQVDHRAKITLAVFLRIPVIGLPIGCGARQLWWMSGANGAPVAKTVVVGAIPCCGGVVRCCTAKGHLSRLVEQRLAALRRIAELLDSAFVVPGTNYRIGLDPIIGLIPMIGDLASPVFTIGLLWQAYDLGIPKVVQLRMIVNAAIDGLVGAIPFVGDLFDFGWKANEWNLALLELHAYEERHAAAGDWIFVVAMIALLIAIAALPFVIAGMLISWLGAHLF